MSDLEEALVDYRKAIGLKLQRYADATKKEQDSFPVLVEKQDVNRPIEVPITVDKEQSRPPKKPEGPVRPPPAKEPITPKNNKNPPKRPDSSPEIQGNDGDYTLPQRLMDVPGPRGAAHATLWRRWGKRALISGALATTGGTIVAVIYYLFMLL